MCFFETKALNYIEYLLSLFSETTELIGNRFGAFLTQSAQNVEKTTSFAAFL